MGGIFPRLALACLVALFRGQLFALHRAARKRHKPRRQLNIFLRLCVNNMFMLMVILGHFFIVGQASKGIRMCSGLRLTVLWLPEADVQATEDLLPGTVALQGCLVPGGGSNKV